MTPRHTRTTVSLALFGLTLVTGCAGTLSGVGGTDTFACKAPPGVTCTSVSGVYANAVANNLPAQRERPARAVRTITALADGAALPVRHPVAGSAPGAGSALRSDARVLRIWLAPWEDSSGDLHDQAYVYVTVDPGKWLIEHTRAPIRRDFAPLKLRAQGEGPAATPSSAPVAEPEAAATTATKLALPGATPAGGPDAQ